MIYRFKSNKGKLVKIMDKAIVVDCTNALLALGHKKRESVKMVKDFFKSDTANNVDEFMEKFFKKKTNNSFK